MKRNSLNTTHSVSHLPDDNPLNLTEPSRSPPAGGVVKGSMNFPANRSARMTSNDLSRSSSQSRSVSPVKETSPTETPHRSSPVNVKNFGMGRNES